MFHSNSFWFGDGAWYPGWALFLTRSVRLTPAQVGAGMTVAGVLGVVSTPVLGWLGDRVGARELFGLQLVAQGAAALAYGAVHDMVGFVAITCVAQVAGSGSGGPRNALVLGLSGEGDRLEILGALLAVSHVGWSRGWPPVRVAVTDDARRSRYRSADPCAHRPGPPGPRRRRASRWPVPACCLPPPRDRDPGRRTRSSCSPPGCT